MSKIVGLCGKAGCGKSTAVSLLHAGIPSMNVKFAQTLYDIQDYIYAMISSVYMPPEDFVKDRKLLQYLGTDWGRSIDASLWIKLWKASVNQQGGGLGKLITCDDVRFNNEAGTILDMGGVIIEIVRPDSDQAAEGGLGIKNHPSELGIDSGLISARVENIGSKEELRNDLIDVLVNLKVIGEDEYGF
jgi:ABC-type dipeptide/oligopeptide/nickel transport system ATPase component